MTNARLTTSPATPRGSSDDLAAALARRLCNPLPDRGAWGLLGAVILGLASFGILPLILWPGTFGEFAADESRAVQGLADWARLRGNRPAAIGPVMAAARDVVAWPIASLACYLMALFVGAAFMMAFAHVPFTLNELIGLTYYHHLNHARALPEHAYKLHFIWVAVLSLGYVLHWLRVQAHIADVTQFVAQLNPVIESEFLPPIPLASQKISLRLTGFVWIVAAIFMGLYGVWWGIPMLMAGAAQRRYMRYGGPRLRRELMRRMTDIAAQRRMPAGAAAPLAAATRCTNARCMAAIRPSARFCTRCGSATGAGR